MVVEGDYTLNVYDESEVFLYNIKVLPAVSGNDNSSLLTYKNESLVIILVIGEHLYNEVGFDSQKIKLKLNGVILTSNKEFDLSNEYEFQYSVTTSTENLYFEMINNAE